MVRPIWPLVLALVFADGVVLAAPKSEGLTKQNIQNVVSANQQQIQGCYAKVRRPELPGKFRAEIKVGKTGKVESVRLKEGSFNSPNASACLEGVIKNWTFMAPIANQPSTFSYPFTVGPALPSSNDPLASEPPIGAPQTVGDAQAYKGRIYKKSNRAIEDPKVLAKLSGNADIKGKADNCENIKILKERCEGLEDKDRVVCSSLTDSPPRKPSTEDWKLIEHPDAFRIASGVYFLGYWHVACGFVKKI